MAQADVQLIHQNDAPSTVWFGHVAVDHPVDGLLTYRVPGDLAGDVKVGSRVVVPLGRGDRRVPGTVMTLTTDAPQFAAEATPVVAVSEESLFPDADQLPEFSIPAAVTTSPGGIKAILDVLRDVHPVPADLLALGQWISTYYATPIGLTLATMVPAAVKKASRLPTQTYVHLTDEVGDLAIWLTAHKLSPKARAALTALHAALQAGPITELDALTRAAIARPMLKRLSASGAVRIEKRVLFPTMETTNPEPRTTNHEPLELTSDQQAALQDILPLLTPSRFAVRLVHGVTGSGKTELYIRAIQEVVAAGKRAIVLVPEISLTPQTVKRFTQRFERVAILHSGLKDAQRHQHWHAIASGWAQVIVGARSAIFAPADNLGLIVVDEEHDPSYKQDNAPRYHGRDVAIRRAQMLNIPILLGSATPALESYHNAQHNPHYKLLAMPTRPLGLQMPRVQIVDMKAQSKERRGLHILSTTLEHFLKQTIDKKKQAIFLLNRRGYAHVCSCPRCDWTLMCDNCDATMVVHRSAAHEPRTTNHESRFQDRYNQVRCHYCLTAMTLPTLCPQCQAKLTYLGQGTQRAEDELARKFPGLRIARMDSDSMRDSIDYQRTLASFAAGEIDLLLGTQMISKGLDFPNVSLVGVLNADLAMTMPDFRAAERTFQLICQVAGRSGRDMSHGGERGTVIVQTFQPYEAAITHACNHDYLGFVNHELPLRKEFEYPPFGRMVRIVLSHKGESKVKTAAEELIRLIQAIAEKLNLPIRWLGPQPPSMARLVELYRSEIILFAATPTPLQRLLAALRARNALAGGPIGIAVDVDPVNML